MINELPFSVLCGQHIIQLWLLTLDFFFMNVTCSSYELQTLRTLLF